MSLFINFIFVLFSLAFVIATSKASWEISIAVILLLGNIFFKVIGIHPLPVPISNIGFQDFVLARADLMNYPFTNNSSGSTSNSTIRYSLQ